ncbi:[Fe-Fe] hydrogenase large subunit C-terminal domain-containing protein [uncultured Rhodospira sp.]|uniref:[Fe-Fe] hydrogenase large subunit C-terminal domain-containing protein n=1 Tax=uncultured Rhodospira sp. TaxID=1936189 RepID=UPI00262916B2|nr:[Fe-Fe] hydrogenase large subunit C-terminal domain-containing protein [uncultured Rhodospira sp.]
MQHISTRCQDCQDPVCKDICPTGSISVEKIGKNYFATVKQNTCISCGSCVRLLSPRKPYRCHGLHIDRSHLNRVIEWIKGRAAISVAIGPGIEYYNNNICLEQASQVCRDLGASYVVRGALFADEVREAIDDEISERVKTEAYVIDNRCAAIRNFLNNFSPRLSSHLIKADSTGLSAARFARHKLKTAGIEGYVVFIGPCVAYKKLVDELETDFDAVLTWAEFYYVCERFGIDICNTPKGFFDNPDFLNIGKIDSGNVKYIPFSGDLHDVLCYRNINTEYFAGQSGRSIIEKLKNIETIKMEPKGFLSPFFCGICTRGPGVFEIWHSQQEASNAVWSPAMQSSEISHDKIIEKIDSDVDLTSPTSKSQMSSDRQFESGRMRNRKDKIVNISYKKSVEAVNIIDIILEKLVTILTHIKRIIGFILPFI